MSAIVPGDFDGGAGSTFAQSRSAMSPEPLMVTNSAPPSSDSVMIRPDAGRSMMPANRAVLFNDATITPKGAPVTDVSAIAKFDLKAGDTLDGVGGFKAYGVMENSPVARAEDLLPMGLTDGCVLKRDLAQDTPITFADVELPAGRLSDQLWREQLAAF